MSRGGRWKRIAPLWEALPVGCISWAAWLAWGTAFWTTAPVMVGVFFTKRSVGSITRWASRQVVSTPMQLATAEDRSTGCSCW